MVELLAPLIGIRGEVEGHMVELVEVLDEGPHGEPAIALMETGADRAIQTNQYGKPLSRHARVRTLPLLSEVEHDVHPVLRSLLPEPVLADLRAALGEADES